MEAILTKTLALVLLFTFSGQPQRMRSAGDWTDWRGPARDGISQEKNLPTKWSPAGDNLAWKAPYGGRSTPIVLGDRVFLVNTAGKGATTQERVMCLDADTGKVIWEYKYNVFESDVPPHRVGWSSPVADPATGNIYVYGVGGMITALSNDGKLLWQKSLTEELGMWTTHGGRTVSPIIDGDLVITSGPTEGWGEHAQRRHRYIAFDKRNGDIVWVSTPGGRPYDTTYSPPIVANVNGTRLFIAGSGDGAIHAIKVQTGEPVWNFVMSKRGINTGVVMKGTTAIVTHSEENLDTSEMGMMAALDATSKGAITKEQAKWVRIAWQGGFSSPVIEGDRLYQLDNGGNLAAFDANTGKQIWLQNLGTIQKASPVLADGKLYVGTENGKFFILKPGADKCEIIDEDQLGTEAQPEAIIASVAISRGRIFLISDTNLYCIGKKSAALPPVAEAQEPASSGPAAHVQVIPAELTIKPGDKVQFRARSFDAQGRFIREETAAWSLEGLKGTVQPNGQFAASTDAITQAGQVKAVVGGENGIAGYARVRIIAPLPINESFDSIAPNAVPAHWINTVGKYSVREMDGNKILVKNPDPQAFKRGRAFFGPADWSDYTIEADVRATGKRRQMGDGGVVAQRYELVLFGNHQEIRLDSWQPETARRVEKPFEWKADTWYRMKLQVENLPDGTARARGKVWPVGEQEPKEWMIERIDPLPNKHGSPGLYADAPQGNEIYFDNVKVVSNK